MTVGRVVADEVRTVRQRYHHLNATAQQNSVAQTTANEQGLVDILRDLAAILYKLNANKSK